MGGSFDGGSNWDKTANEIDKCFKIYLFREGTAEIASTGNIYSLQKGNLYFINGFAIELLITKNHCYHFFIPKTK